MTAIPASDNVFETLRMAEAAAPSTPPSAQTVIYTKADGRIYWKDDAGTEYSVASLADIAGGSVALDDLTDVDTSGVASGDVLSYDGADWVPVTPGGSGLAASVIGYNTIGASNQNAAQKIFMKKVTIGSTFVMTSIGVYIKQVTAGEIVGINVALLTDNGGSPELLIAGSVGNATDGFFLATANGSAGAARWVDRPLGTAPLASGDYWLAVNVRDTGTGTTHNVYYDGSGSDRTFLPSSFRVTDSGWSSVTTTSNKYSIRATILS